MENSAESLQNQQHSEQLNSQSESSGYFSSQTRVHKVDNIPESYYWNAYVIGGVVALLGCILLVLKRKA